MTETASIFAAVQAAVEDVHRQLLNLARRDPDSALAGAKYEELEARDGGLYRIGEKSSGATYSDILRKAKQDFVEVEKE
jgi:xanthine dehydrogenase YagR molybdenum-binding subunit